MPRGIYDRAAMKKPNPAVKKPSSVAQPVPFPATKKVATVFKPPEPWPFVEPLTPAEHFGKQPVTLVLHVEIDAERFADGGSVAEIIEKANEVGKVMRAELQNVPPTIVLMK